MLTHNYTQACKYTNKHIYTPIHTKDLFTVSQHCQQSQSISLLAISLTQAKFSDQHAHSQTCVLTVQHWPVVRRSPILVWLSTSSTHCQFSSPVLLATFFTDHEVVVVEQIPPGHLTTIHLFAHVSQYNVLGHILRTALNHVP